MFSQNAWHFSKHFLSTSHYAKRYYLLVISLIYLIGKMFMYHQFSRPKILTVLIKTDADRYVNITFASEIFTGTSIS